MRFKSDLIPKQLAIARYFQKEQDEIDKRQTELETLTAELDELEQEHNSEEGVFGELDKVNLKTVKAHLKALEDDPVGLMPEDAEVLMKYIKLAGNEQLTKQMLKTVSADLDQKLRAKYGKLTEPEIKDMVVDDKWLATIAGAVQGEVDRLSQALTKRVRQLAQRYDKTLPRSRWTWMAFRNG